MQLAYCCLAHLWLMRAGEDILILLQSSATCVREGGAHNALSDTCSGLRML